MSSDVPGLGDNTCLCGHFSPQGKRVSRGVLPYMFLFNKKLKLNVVPSPVHLSDCCCVPLNFFLPVHPTCPFGPHQIVLRSEFQAVLNCVLGELETAAAETLF